MVEEWKDIVVEKNGVIYDYSGLYQVSNMGRVRSLNYNKTGEIKILKLRNGRNGYKDILLHKNGKTKRHSVHRLVAFGFVSNDDPINKTQVNHIDENKQNNVWTNLEWTTPKENTNHGTCQIRRTKKRNKRVICVETGVIYESTMDVERKTGLPHKCISRCCRGKQGTCNDYHWLWYSDYLIEQLIIN